MGELYDLEQIRRGQRLFAIFVDRFGVEHFLADDTGWMPRLDPARVEEALKLARGWLERRGRRDVSKATLGLLRRDLKRALLVALAERLVRAGF